MALIAMCFKLMQDDVVQKARWLGQKIGILGKIFYSSTDNVDNFILRIYFNMVRKKEYLEESSSSCDFFACDK